MADYVKSVDFASKDALVSGDPNKIVRGTEIDAEFEALETSIATKADLVSPAFLGSPTAPTPASNADNTQVATTAFVRDVIPAGVILAWSGSVAAIPVGWQLCDGTNGTPNLRDRFIVGAGSSYAVGATGGTKDAVVVSHTHTATVTDPGHTHDYSITLYDEAGSGDFVAGSDGPPVDGTYSGTTASKVTGVTVGISTDGVSGTDQNLPPYLALAWIMKL
jgi:microcystin-dependent protein